jgi:hypothetical protein
MSTQMASQQQMHGQNVVEDTIQVEIEIKKRTFDACHACLLRMMIYTHLKETVDTQKCSKEVLSIMNEL